MKKKLGVIILIIIIFTILLSFKKKDNYYKYDDNSYIAVVVDGESLPSIPVKGNYSVKSVCSGGKAKWNYDDWSLEVTNIINTARCLLTFTTVEPVNLASYIMGLGESAGVYNEPETDYRYQGEDPDNFIYFNNELWRIIGVFSDNTHGKTGEKLVKIIRNDSLG
ncbi:MAG: hypothetical protein WCR80_06260, partial [Bacilli bacterium]